MKKEPLVIIFGHPAAARVRAGLSPEVQSCEAQWTSNHTGIKAIWKAFEAARHL